MDNKLLLIFILLFLSFLLLFYYLKLKTNIIMFLSIIIVLCVNKLIIQKEYYKDKQSTKAQKKLIKRGLIDYMLDDEPVSNFNTFMPFLGSEPNKSIATTSVNTNEEQPSWNEILSEMRDEINTEPVNNSKAIPTFSFLKSLETPTTSTNNK